MMQCDEDDKIRMAKVLADGHFGMRERFRREIPKHAERLFATWYLFM
jgi:hypothetical protein